MTDPGLIVRHAVVVFAAPDVGFCFECGDTPTWPDARDNEIFLCGPDHSPLNGEANYFCRAHLDSGAVIDGDEDIQK